MRLKYVVGLLGASVLTGCTPLFYHQNGSAPSVDYVATDAKQRLVTFIEPGTPSNNGRVNPKRLVCAEPSPDVASAYSFALETMLKYNNGKTDASAGVNLSVAESLLQLGKRIATVQLLRDELSDLCRSYANGAVSNATYTIRLSRLDKKMVTLLSSEAAAGAVTEATKSIVGAAQLSGAATSAEVQVQRDKVSKDVDAIKAANDAMAKDGNDTNKEALKKAIEQLAADNTELTKAMEKNAHTALSAGAVVKGGEGMGGLASSPQVVEEIQENYLRVDDASTIMDACLTVMTEKSQVSIINTEIAMTGKKLAESKEGTEEHDGLKKIFKGLLDKKEELVKKPGIAELTDNNSPMLAYCPSALITIQEQIKRQAQDRHALEMAKVGQAEQQVILHCQEALLGSNQPLELVSYCKAKLSPLTPEPAKPIQKPDDGPKTGTNPPTKTKEPKPTEKP